MRESRAFRWFAIVVVAASIRLTAARSLVCSMDGPGCLVRSLALVPLALPSRASCHHRLAPDRLVMRIWL